ncbi:MAG: adenylosuccinate lyase [Phycisphaerales bacterium]|nr:adenylosuccinate lyase [Phycisphaerales bacterium]
MASSPQPTNPAIRPEHSPTPVSAPGSSLDGYVSPLSGRYASPEMQAVWSARRKFEGWRRIWHAVAQVQHEMGLPVTGEQVRALGACLVVTDEELRRAEAHERRLRHDVMAHVHALGESAPAAAGIIHLGLTSQDVNCNTEIPLLRDGLEIVCRKAAALIDALAALAEKHKADPCLAFTHYQPAQPTTVGKRCAMWGQEIAVVLERLEQTQASLRLRGFKGATGTQASFLALFKGDGAKVEEFERRVSEKLGFGPDRLLASTGQTYPRVVDALVLNDLAVLAAALHRLATDVRLLCGRGELDEPWEKDQIGSSAMPYKRNPMRCERACGLCRFVISLASSALDTAATQWLERTLDDSSNRRLVLPEAFLALDGALDAVRSVAAGLVVHAGAARRHLEEEMAFLATENLMMRAVELGGDRQRVHEAIRRHALASAERRKREGGTGDLPERLRAEPLLRGVDLSAALDPSAYTGLAARQAERFAAEVAGPVRRRYAGRLPGPPDLRV